MRRWMWVFFVCLCSRASADGLIIVPHPPVPPPTPHHAFAPLEVVFHRVEVQVEDQIASTSVDQVFRNPLPARLEGVYVFPLPRAAHLERYAMEIDGEEVEAELVDAQTARRLFEDIVRQTKDPALLEYAGQGMFRVRVFPIEPHGTKRVVFRYSEVLKADGGTVAYAYPLNTEKFSSKELEEVSVRVRIRSTRGIRSVFCPSHEAQISVEGSEASVTYEASHVRPDRDFQVFFSPEPPTGVALDVFTHRDPQDPEGGFFLLLASPPVPRGSSPPPKDVVFALDTSGSMAQGRKLDQAKAALDYCLTHLGSEDRFEVVRFSTEAQALFGQVVSASEAHRVRAREFVAGLSPVGGTALYDALLMALRSLEAGHDRRASMVVLLTDGQPTVGPTSTEEIVARVMEERGQREVRIFSFGLGTDVNAHLLDLLAEKTRATTQYVLPEQEIQREVSSFFDKIQWPALSQVHLQVEGEVSISQVVPPRMPDLFQADQLVVAGRYTGHGPAVVTLQGTSGGEPVRFRREVLFPEASAAHEYIPWVWATRRVGFLLDEIRLRGEHAELRDEVVRLARRFGIITPYTAYLIMEDENRRSVDSGERVMPGSGEGVGTAMEKVYRALSSTESGPGAVGAAVGLSQLKRAGSLSAPQMAQDGFSRAIRATPLGDQARQAISQAVDPQRVRVRAGKAFFFNGTAWVDASVQDHPHSPRVKVAVGSRDYFALLDRDPRAGQWLSVGSPLTVFLDGTVYVVE